MQISFLYCVFLLWPAWGSRGWPKVKFSGFRKTCWKKGFFSGHPYVHTKSFLLDLVDSRICRGEKHFKKGVLKSSNYSGWVREEPCKKNACSNGILPDSVSTPPPSSKRTLCGRYFSPKMDKFFKTAILTLGMDIFTITVVKHGS